MEANDLLIPPEHIIEFIHQVHSCRLPPKEACRGLNQQLWWAWCSDAFSRIKSLSAFGLEPNSVLAPAASCDGPSRCSHLRPEGNFARYYNNKPSFCSEKLFWLHIIVIERHQLAALIYTWFIWRWSGLSESSVKKKRKIIKQATALGMSQESMQSCKNANSIHANVYWS